MKQYKVIALSVGGRSNKIFSAGDTVSEDSFIPGRADELEKQGFLKSIGETDVQAMPLSSDEIETEIVTTEEPEPQESEEVSSILSRLKESLGELDKTEVTIDSMSRKEIIKTLTELGIPFDNNASKKELFSLWLSRSNY